MNEIDFSVQVRRRESYELVRNVCNECVYMKNPTGGSNRVPFVHRVDYTGLLSNLTGEFPSCFFKKFQELRDTFGNPVKWGAVYRSISSKERIGSRVFLKKLS